MKKIHIMMLIAAFVALIGAASTMSGPAFAAGLGAKVQELYSRFGGTAGEFVAEDDRIVFVSHGTHDVRGAFGSCLGESLGDGRYVWRHTAGGC